jgi:PAS domain S-box-containing protein
MDVTERTQVEEVLRTERALLSERVEERTASLVAATKALQTELQERMQIEAALRKAEAEYRTLFDNVPIGIYRSSLAGRQLRANPALAALNGYETEAELLAAVHDIATEWYVDGTRRAEFQRKLNEDGVVGNFESEIYRHKSRERIWISETALLVRNSEGRPLYYQGTVQDITERKANEAAQARIIEQLANVARLKDEFLANMSHELRTPLNSILGMSEALHDEIYGAISERQRKALHTIESSGRHLLALINDILDLAKIESGQVELVRDAVDMVAVCDSVLRLVQPTTSKKQITVEFVHDPQVKIMLADGRRLKQILINLLSNAIKFTPTAGRIGLEVTAASEPTPVVHLTVWDTGVGIPDDARVHLFEPFVQVDSSLSRRYEGTGLGLALVQRMAELHGGTVTVESQVGQGSRFIVTLPWLRPPLEEKLARGTADTPVASVAPAPPLSTIGEKMTG